MANKKFTLNAPKKVTFWIAVFLGAVSVVGLISKIDVVSGIAPITLAIAWLLLALGCFVKGM